MNYFVFTNIIDEIKNYVFEIGLADWGEPFLNPHIFDMIRYADDNKIMTSASTNFHKFESQDDLMKIIDSKLTFLTISLHGMSQETYGTYQPGKNYEDTIKKIKDVIDLKKKNRSKTPIIDFRFAITKKNQHEINIMKSFAENLHCDYTIHTASLNLRFYLNDRAPLRDLIHGWAQTKHYEDCDNLNLEKINIEDFFKMLLKSESDNDLKTNISNNPDLMAKYYCMDPWESLTVNWDGTISLCCTDYNKYILGDTRKEEISTIWNNNEYQKVRKYLKNPDIDNNEHIPCKYCIKF
jgi:radical SAM protein with 4Fe4S-binding SPASM domain